MNRPILFSTDMVKALPDGRKTMTRRLRNLKKINEDSDRWEFVRIYNGVAKFCEKYNWTNEVYLKCPYGQPGDTLWVRESWRYAGKYVSKPDHSAMSPKNFIYKADEEWNVPFKPSIHMPRSAARIWLNVSEVRAERLHDITEQDAKAEGVLFDEERQLYWDYVIGRWGIKTAVESFQSLWEKINGKESWDSNPWVWVVGFEKMEKL